MILMIIIIQTCNILYINCQHAHRHLAFSPLLATKSTVSSTAATDDLRET